MNIQPTLPGYLMQRVHRAIKMEWLKPIHPSEDIPALVQRFHYAAMKALDRHAPRDHMAMGLTMEQYETYLGEEFPAQIKEYCTHKPAIIMPGQPCSANLVAVCMKAYEDFLGSGFRNQMTEHYGLEYPLNFEMKEL